MPVSTVGTTLAADRLGVSSVASFALNAAAPIMVVGAYVTTAWAVTGAVPVSLALLGMGAILAVWAVGYVSMARHVVNAGSLYTFLAHGLGPRTATTGAAVQLLAYSMLQWGLYGIVGVQAASLAADKLDVHLPWWAWALLAWAVVAWLGTRGVVLGSRLLAGAIVVETLLVGLIIAVDLTHPAPGGVSFAALDPTRITSGSLGALIAISVTAFVGIEAVPVYSEEARQPKKTIMAATYLALILMVVVYVLGSWAMSVAVGPDQVIATARRMGPDMLAVPASTHLGGSLLVDTVRALMLTSISAGLMAYHNAVARCTFSLARDRILPRALGRTNARSGAPVAASLAQSATGLAVILLFALAGWDPLTRLFFWLGTTGALGVLVLMTGASFAVIGYFARDRRGESTWATRIAPTLAGLALTACVVLVVDNYASLLGVAPTSPPRWALPAAYLAVAGVAWSLSPANRRTHALRRIGYGANAAESAPLGGLR